MNTAKFKVKQAKSLYNGSMDNCDLLYKNRFNIIIKLFLVFIVLAICTKLNYNNIINLVFFNNVHELKELFFYGLGVLGVYSSLQS